MNWVLIHPMGIGVIHDYPNNETCLNRQTVGNVTT